MASDRLLGILGFLGDQLFKEKDVPVIDKSRYMTNGNASINPVNEYIASDNVPGTPLRGTQFSGLAQQYGDRDLRVDPMKLQTAPMSRELEQNTMEQNIVDRQKQLNLPPESNVDQTELLSTADSSSIAPSFGSDQPVMPTKPTFTQKDFDKVYANQFGQIDKEKQDTGSYSKLKNLWNDEKFWTTFALGLNSMRLSPDATLATVLGKKLEKLESGTTREKAYQQIMELYRKEQDPKEKQRLLAIANATRNGIYDGDKAMNQALKRESGINIDMNGNKISPIFKKIDEEFAKDMPKLIGGGAMDTVGQLQAIEEVMGALESGKELTGALIGQLPDSFLAFVNPDAVANRELIEQTVQRSLRETLGAQFTEKEGERLIKRAYNPTLDEKTNLRRVRRLYTAMMTAFKQRQAMAEYAQKNGTLQGYTGYQPTMRDMWSAVSGIQIGTEQEGMIYIGGDPSKQSSWKEK